MRACVLCRSKYFISVWMWTAHVLNKLTRIPSDFVLVVGGRAFSSHEKPKRMNSKSLTFLFGRNNFIFASWNVIHISFLVNRIACRRWIFRTLFRVFSVPVRLLTPRLTKPQEKSNTVQTNGRTNGRKEFVIFFFVWNNFLVNECDRCFLLSSHDDNEVSPKWMNKNTKNR